MQQALIPDHFQLRRLPFSQEIEAQALYKFRSFAQGEKRLEQGAHQRGMVLVAGEPGAGKTALARHFCHRLASSTYKILYTPTPMVKSPIGVRRISPVDCMCGTAHARTLKKSRSIRLNSPVGA